MKMFEVARLIKNLNSERQVNTAVIDCLKNIESKMALAEHFYRRADDAPEYIEEAVKGLLGWLEHTSAK